MVDAPFLFNDSINSYINNMSIKAMKIAAIKRLYNTDRNKRRIKRIIKNATMRNNHTPIEVDSK